MNSATNLRLAMVLGGALLLLGGAAVATRVREDRPSRIALTRVDIGGVDSVTIVRPGDTALLARREKGAWQVNGHAADTARVHELLRALADTSAWGELAAESGSSYARLGVGADSGRHLRVIARGKAVLDITAGMRTEDYGGVYVRRAADSAVYALHGANVADPFTRSADDWRDKHIARVLPDSVAAIDVRRGDRSFSLKRDGVHWTVRGGAADSSAVASMLENFRDFSAVGFATPAQADSANFRNPKGVVKLEGKNGALLLSLEFDSTSSGVWARTDATGPVFRLDAYQLARLAPAESTLKAKKKAAK